ncbi:hypothetical protein KW798_03270 [Candidatus Parcubacteria bacterium]|nr:hypothetical protein [Candidatus Parcubacteria bacterium]
MSKETSVILLGLWVIIVPQLGIPSPWRTLLLVLSGLALIIIGLYLRAESSHRTRKGASFVENAPPAGSASIVADYSDDRKEGINSLN